MLNAATLAGLESALFPEGAVSAFADSLFAAAPRQGGPAGGSIRAIAIDPVNPDIVYAGALGGGVFKSTDGGESWAPSSSGLTSLVVVSLAIHPATTNLLFAGTIGGGLFQSTDGGSNWAVVTSGLPVDPPLSDPPVVSSLTIDPDQPDTIFGAVFGTSADGIYKSTDRGATWFESGRFQTPVLALAIDPSQTSTLYAGTGEGVFKSSDGGQAWVATNAGLRDSEILDDVPGYVVLSLTIDPSDSATVYAGTLGNGVFKSTDAGASWAAVNSGLPPLEVAESPPVVTSLIVDPSNPSTIYAGISAGTQDDGVFKSTNGGQSWAAANVDRKFDLKPTHVLALVIDPTSPATVFAGTFGRGVFKSITGADSWTPANSGLNAGMVVALAIDPSSPATVYAGTGNGLFKSTDSGQAWVDISRGIWNALVTAVAIDPINPSTVYVGTGIPGGVGSTGVFKTTNGGDSWNYVSIGLPIQPWLSIVTSLAVDPSNPETVYAGTLGGVFKTTNGGTSWIEANSGLQATEVTVAGHEPDFIVVLDVAVDPFNPSTVYAVTPGRDIYRSTDGGANWATISSSLPFANLWALAIDPSNPSTLYSVTAGDGVFRSTDEGTVWSGLSSGLTGAHTGPVAIDPTDSHIVYVVNRETGLMKTTNGGQVWTPVDLPLPLPYPSAGSPDIQSLAIDPVNPAILYLGTRDESFEALVFKTTDGGQSWSDASSGLEETYSPVASLVIDPSSPSTLYAGTGGGLFKSSNGGQSWALANSSLFDVESVAIDPVSPAVLYAAGFDNDDSRNGVLKSTNGGQDWTSAYSGLPASLISKSLAIDPINPSVLYTAGFDWNASRARVFKTTNGGQSWFIASSELEQRYEISSLVIDPSNPATLYAGTDNGIFKSLDGAASWRLGSGLMYLSIRNLTIDPNSPATLYAATWDGFFKSTDSGRAGFRPARIFR